MDSGRKIKVSVVIKRINEGKATNVRNNDSMDTLDHIKSLVNKVSNGEDIDKETILHLVKASKLSGEIMADAFCDVDREDLFESKMKSVSTLDELINQIINL